jgi:hypothetical protein
LSAFRFLLLPEASLKESFVARMERSEIRDRHLEALRSSPDSQALHPGYGLLIRGRGAKLGREQKRAARTDFYFRPRANRGGEHSFRHGWTELCPTGTGAPIEKLRLAVEAEQNV